MVLYEQSRAGGARVVLCSRAAVEAGVKPGIPAAEATALLGQGRAAHFVEADPAADRTALAAAAGSVCRPIPIASHSRDDTFARGSR